jgi:oligopeptide/dipeptide ABC transporter ATP-binding protein
MRQRVMIAIALSCNPKLVIADEPTTALDVTIEAQILDLLKKLKEQYSLSVLLITHDLGVVADATDRVAVMYAGKIVEQGFTEEIFDDPAHPYTQGLLMSVPRRSRNTPKKNRLDTIPGSVPNLINLPAGCSFEPRCKSRMDICTTTMPPMFNMSDSHRVRCYLHAVSR